MRNTHYNPGGEIEALRYRFPYDDGQSDVVFAASVFTHMKPENVTRYFAEAGRVLRRGGRCLFSFFLLDNYLPARERPRPFAAGDFDFTEDVRRLQVPTLFACADADMFPPSHAVEVFALLDGGQRDGGWMAEGRPKGGHALAILPGLTHYSIFRSPLLAETAISFLSA